MSITDKPIALQEFFSEPSPQSCGAVASFVGIVRNHDHGRSVKFLYYDCYRFMAEKVMRTIVEEALNRWDVEKAQVSHRVGRLGIGDVAVAISVSAAHRAEAFEACRFVIEEIKERVPIWKREIFEDGTSEWVSCAHAETHG